MGNKITIWILTEEKPAIETISILLMELCKLKKIPIYVTGLAIIPILNKRKNFIFEYKIVGWHSPIVEDIKIKLIKGTTSFVDYLVYITKANEEPNPYKEPILALEETKTNPNESRNVNIYQRLIKFVYLKHYYKTSRLIMFYNFPKECFNKQIKKETNTYNFGIKLLKTLGVKIFERIDNKIYEINGKAFKNIEDIIHVKSKFLAKNNKDIPINIVYNPEKEEIAISIKLDKGKKKETQGKPSHDPNKGLLGALIYIFREVFNYSGKIIVKNHGINLNYSFENSEDKLINLLKKYNIELEGIGVLKNPNFPDLYWDYDYKTEKNVSIFTSITIDFFSKGYIVFENHAGSGRGYLIIDGNCISINKKIKIPDLTILDNENKQIIICEAKKYEKRKAGLKQLLEIEKSFGVFLKKTLSKKSVFKKYNFFYSLLLYAININKQKIEKLYMDREYSNYVALVLNKISNLKECEIIPNKDPNFKIKIINKAINNLNSYWDKNFKF